MADSLATAAGWLQKSLQQHAGRGITYERGSLATNIPDALVGRTDFEITDDSGVVTRWESRDFIFSRTQLVLGGAAAEPNAGDKIKESDSSGTTYIYEVMAPPGEPVWSFHDPFRVLMRVHTKRTGTE